MYCLEICTSKPGKLWTTGYWKTLIDALSRDGAKGNPIQHYPDLTQPLQAMVEKRGVRYFPKRDSLLADSDDSVLKVIILHRVRVGQEELRIGKVQFPTTTHWSCISFPFFGTIGNSQYEAQSKLNRETLVRDHSEVFLASHDSRCLGLAFQQTTLRRDRDLDNLADALIPVFNSHFRQLDKLCLVKLDSVTSDREFLRITTREQDMVFHLSADRAA